MRSAGFARWLLDNAQVAVVPGIAFGVAGDTHVRLSLATAPAEYDEAVARLAQALSGLSERNTA